MVKKMTKKILVFDDTQANLVIAEELLKKRGIEGIYLSDQADAIRRIEQEGDALYGVISDLFADASTDYVSLIKEDILFNYIAEVIDDVRDLDWQHPDKKRFTYASESRDELRKVDENPSGLGVVETCYNLGVPVVLLSQGNRHTGNLGRIRQALKFSPKYLNLTGSDDPLYKMLAGGGVDQDKTIERTWDMTLQKLVKRVEAFIAEIQVAGMYKRIWSGNADDLTRARQLETYRQVERAVEAYHGVSSRLEREIETTTLDDFPYYEKFEAWVHEAHAKYHLAKAKTQELSKEDPKTEYEEAKTFYRLLGVSMDALAATCVTEDMARMAFEGNAQHARTAAYSIGQIIAEL